MNVCLGRPVWHHGKSHSTSIFLHAVPRCLCTCHFPDWSLSQILLSKYVSGYLRPSCCMICHTRSFTVPLPTSPNSSLAEYHLVTPSNFHFFKSPMFLTFYKLLILPEKIPHYSPSRYTHARLFLCPSLPSLTSLCLANFYILFRTP